MSNKYAKYSKTQKHTPFLPEATLDYHDRGTLSTYDIERELNIFLEDSYNHDLSQLLIITGKGHNSPQGPIVRPFVGQLLKKHYLVAKYKQADDSRGGAGAFEVTLIE